jgi:hypothetical protein
MTNEKRIWVWTYFAADGSVSHQYRRSEFAHRTILDAYPARDRFTVIEHGHIGIIRDDNTDRLIATFTLVEE